MSISFLCSVLESVLMSTPLSYITMREDEGYKAATLFKKYKMDNARAIAAILSLNTAWAVRPRWCSTASPSEW